MFERNKQGDTPMSICQSLKNKAVIDMLEKLQVIYDKSQSKTEDLFASLAAEEEQAARQREKRNQKKYQQKLKKLAERDNCSKEETEKRL